MNFNNIKIIYGALFLVSMLLSACGGGGSTTPATSGIVPTITGFTPSSGATGTTVTITGTNFDATAANDTVKFNGVTASVTSASTTQLTVTVPATATTGTISVTTAGGTATSATSFFTTVPPAPTGVAALCGNMKITVSWSAVTGATSYNVYRSTTSGTGTTGTPLSSPTTTSYVDTTGAVGTTYYYTVAAVNNVGASLASAEVSETFYKVLAGAMQGKSLAIATNAGNVTTFAGSSGHSGLPVSPAVGSAARFNLPQGMTTDGTYLYVADYLNNGIQRIDPTTQTVTLFAGSPTGVSGSADGVGTAARFLRPYDITNDGTNLYVTDYNNCTIRKIVIATANVTTFAGTVGSCSPLTNGVGTGAILVSPQGITTDGTSLFVTENTTVRRIDIASQAVSTFAGTGSVGHVDAVGTAASFNNLEGITTDGTSLFVVDRFYQDIRKIDIASATVSSFAGNYTNVTTSTSNDGTGIAATFYIPIGITTDGTNLYVMEYWGDVVRKVVIASAAATTLAGSSGLTGTADGTGTVARFSSPMGITTYCGKLYIGDTGNGSIRLLQ